MEHSAEDLAYIAGLFDGEGSICIVAKPIKNHFPTHYLVASIANTHRATIEWIQQTFGCGYLNNPKPISPKHKPIWICNIQSNPAARFLQTILPYLTVKQEQAKVALDFYNYHQKTSHHATEETVKYKEEYRQRIKELNKRSRETIYPVATIDSTTDIASLAGFFDGEGSVSITMRESRGKSGNELPLYGLKTSIGNTDYPILLRYQSLFSGAITPMRSISPNKKPTWHWILGGDMAQTFLKAILPYLRVKREQVILAIEFQDYHRTHWQSQLIHCTTEVLARKEDYRQRVSKLALYGRTKKPLPDRFAN